MKRKVSLSGFLHNDRIVLVLSFILAIVVWGVVVYGPSNEQERTVSGVPVVVSLGEYATDTLNMQIVSGQDLTVSVKVYGRRSVVEQLTAQDLLVTADTSAVIAPGSYSGLSIKAAKNGKQTDFEILSVEPSVTSLTCDIWVESTFEVQSQINNLTSADKAKYQLGTPVVSSDAFENGSIKVSGPKAEIDKIASITAVVEDTMALSETQVFDANLKALDANGKEVDISHCVINGENSPIKVTVPILFYKKVDLSYTLANAPEAYASRKNLVKFQPQSLELWGTEQTIEDFEKQLQTLCTFDFDHMLQTDMKQELALEIPETLKILGGVEKITAQFDLTGISSRKMSLDLEAATVKVINCPDGVKVSPVEKSLGNVTICGPAYVINRIQAKDIEVIVDVQNDATLGQRTLHTRIQLPKHNNVWVYYGETGAGYDLLTTLEK